MTDTPAPKLSRDLLAKYFGNDPRMVRAFEDLSLTTQETADTVASSAAATTAIQDATVLTLSPNATFTNERVLLLGEGLVYVNDDGDTITIKALGLAVTGTRRVELIAQGDARLFVPLSGTLASCEGPEVLSLKTLDAPSLSSVNNYANDAAAATGGVPVGGIYHTTGTLKVRLT